MNTKDEYAEFVEGFLIAADTDGTGDEMIKDIEESPYPWGAPWMWDGKGWQPQLASHGARLVQDGTSRTPRRSENWLKNQKKYKNTLPFSQKRVE